jgi:hypothetical protein
MTRSGPVNTREVARNAIRARRAHSALEFFLGNGFDNLTVNDVAAAAGRLVQSDAERDLTAQLDQTFEALTVGRLRTFGRRRVGHQRGQR